MILGDVLDRNTVEQAIFGNDVVFNYAGISDIDECHKKPIDAINMNILGNALILEDQST